MRETFDGKMNVTLKWILVKFYNLFVINANISINKILTLMR